MSKLLGAATSPYLLQHADNPVDWWEWGDEAFAEARSRNVPVLISVGYAACHWCHVMAHESFEDETTAAYMNEHFVNIKVDREERPDVDSVYMQATVAMTGQGGWPMTVVTDHEGAPYFAGTYFPDQPRHGQPAFMQVLQAVSQAWTEQADAVRATADRVREALAKQELSGPSASFESADLDAAAKKLRGQFDGRFGGLLGAPKFPPSMLVDFLMRHDPQGNRVMVLETLKAMAGGGMYDQLGGGFARYSVDDRWVVPHFEKMLYDNAQLMARYAEASVIYADDPEAGYLADVARQTAQFVVDELRTEQGAFASSFDADTDGKEGIFYVWTPAQLVEALGEEDGRWAAEFLLVTEQGTFEAGASVLQLRRRPLVGSAEETRWVRVRSRLLEARVARSKPDRDDKVVAAWNGLAISGLLKVGLLSDMPAAVDAAIKAAEFVAESHVRDGELKRVSRDGVVGAHLGVLEDYGVLATALCELAAAQNDVRWLELAGRLLDHAVEHFAADDGGFFDTSDLAEQLVVRPSDPGDNASPSGHSAMIHGLLTYSALTGSGSHRTAAEVALKKYRSLAESSPLFAGHALAAAAVAVDGPAEVVVVAEAESERSQLAAQVRRKVPSGTVVVASRPSDSEQLGLIPLAAGRRLVDGKPAIYVCRNHVCNAPVTSLDDLNL